MDPTELFQNTALSASYYASLQRNMEKAFGEQIDSTHSDKRVHDNVRNLGISISQQLSGIKQHGFQARDILRLDTRRMKKAVESFNNNLLSKQCLITPDPDDPLREDIDGPLEEVYEPIYNIDRYIEEPEGDYQ